MNMVFVDQLDVFGRSVIPFEHLDIVFLDLSGLLDNMFIGIGQIFLKESLPFLIGKSDIIQLFQLKTKIRFQFCFFMNRKILI